MEPAGRMNVFAFARQHVSDGVLREPVDAHVWADGTQLIRDRDVTAGMP